MKRTLSLLLVLLTCLSLIVFPTHATASAATINESSTFPMDELKIVRTNTKLDKDQEKIAAKDGGHVWFGWDLSGGDTSLEAPFTGTVLYKDNGGTHAVFFQSTDKVYLPNGKLDYVTLMLCHDDNVNDLKVGQKITKGSHLYDQGTFGNGKKGTYDRHVHIEAAVGKLGVSNKNSLSKNLSLIRNNNVGIQLYDCFYLKSSCKRTRDYIVVVCQGNKKITFSWKTLVDINKVNITTVNKAFTGSNIAVKDMLSVKNGSTALTAGKNFVLSRDTVKNVGKYDVTITGIAQYYGSVKKTVTVTPKAPTITSLSAVKTLNRVIVKWSAVSGVSGYRIQISRDKNFSGAHTSNVDSSTTTISYNKVSWGTLKKGVTYYVRVAAKQKVSYGGSTVEILSAWSPVKTIKY